MGASPRDAATPPGRGPSRDRDRGAPGAHRSARAALPSRHAPIPRDPAALPPALALRLVLALLLTVPVACGPTSDSADPAAREGAFSRVVLLSIDTLRADVLSPYSEEVDTTPAIEALAAESQVFLDTLAQASTTGPSHKSIFSSVYPSVHKQERRSGPVEELLTSPVAVMKQAGFATAAFVGGGRLARYFGFGEAFDTFWEAHLEAERHERLAATEAQAFAWLDDHADDPFFLFVHTYQVHCPYEPPEPYRSEHASWYEGGLDATGKCGSTSFGHESMTEDDYRYLRALYAGEVAYVDAFVGRLTARLEHLGIDDETLVVLLSDHGESFGEHRRVGHGELWDVELRIPFLVRVPGLPGARHPEPAQALDLMPTLFPLLGLEPPYDFQGIDLLDERPSERLRIAERSDLVTLEQGRWKLIAQVGAEQQGVMLFDREADPDELNEVAAQHPQVVARLLAADRDRRRAAGRLEAAFRLVDEETPLDPETEADLRALGYIR